MGTHTPSNPGRRVVTVDRKKYGDRLRVVMDGDRIVSVKVLPGSGVGQGCDPRKPWDHGQWVARGFSQFLRRANRKEIG